MYILFSVGNLMQVFAYGSKKKKNNTHKDLNSVRSPMSPVSCPFRPMVDNPLRIIENNKIDKLKHQKQIKDKKKIKCSKEKKNGGSK
jgi:hypothetical protein